MLSDVLALTEPAAEVRDDKEEQMTSVGEIVCGERWKEAIA